jgi:hypothetical protein
MKRVILAATTCLALGGASVLVFHGQTALTETDLAIRDHDKLVSAIKDMCPDNSITTNQVDVRTTLVSNKEVSDPAKSLSKPTPFQMAAANYSAELRDQRIKLDQEITGGELVSRWFKVAIAACGGLATITIGLKPLFERISNKPLFERISNVSLNTGIATAAIIFSGTVGTLASLSGFADTQAQLLQHQRTLAQLQQLHWRVGNDVFAATSLCEGKDNPDLAKVGDWKDRFEEIWNEAMPSVAKPGDIRQNPSASRPTERGEKVFAHQGVQEAGIGKPGLTTSN